jgi:hypothetical protein
VRGDGAILGGHDVPLVKYDGAGGGMFYCVTWGRLQPVTPRGLTLMASRKNWRRCEACRAGASRAWRCAAASGYACGGAQVREA